MNRVAATVLLYVIVLGASCTCAQENFSTTSPQIDEEHTKWIASVLRAVQTIKVGMTRSELMTGFTTEGGISTTSQRTYVYRQCPYIKVDVKFAAWSREEELPTDKIVQISRPYLASSVTD
jgi:hypothetical protein